MFSPVICEVANYSLLPAKPRKDHQYFILGDVVGLNIAAAVFGLLAVLVLALRGPSSGADPTSPAVAVRGFHPALHQTLAHAFRIHLFSNYAPDSVV